jgi:hypothetical protein
MPVVALMQLLPRSTVPRAHLPPAADGFADASSCRNHWARGDLQLRS